MLPEDAEFPNLLMSTLDHVDGYEVSEVISAVFWQEPDRELKLFRPGRFPRGNHLGTLNEEEQSRGNAIIGIKVFWPDNGGRMPELSPVFFTGTLVALRKTERSDGFPDAG